ncbi:MAG: LAGLIDADG family homing endonuclease [Candidatus Helarchaeota archaeon]
MILEKISKEELEFADIFFNPKAMIECLFVHKIDNFDTLQKFRDDDFFKLRLYQIPFISYEYMLAEDPKLTKSQNFEKKKGAGSGYYYCGRKIGKCEYENNMCTLASGEQIKFKDLKGKTAKVISLDETNFKLTNGNATFFDNGKKPCWNVILESGKEIILTANHPLLTGQGWKSVKELRIGEYIATPRRISINKGKEVDEQEAKLLGYLLGDGSCSQTTIGFTNINKEIRKEIYKLADYFDCSVRKKGANYYFKHKNKPRRLSNGAKIKNNIQDLVIKYKINKLAKEKQIPKEVFTWKNKYIKLLLNRLYACDGYVNEKQYNIEIVLASKIMIKQIQSLLLRFGIHSNIRYKPSKYNDKFFDAWRLYICKDYDKFLNIIGIFTKDKVVRRKVKYSTSDRIPKFFIEKNYGSCKNFIRKHRVDKMLNYNSSRKKWQKIAEDVNDSEIKKIAYSDIYWEKIIKISSVGLQPTIAVQVSKYKNYISNDIISHNSLVSLLMDLALNTIYNCTDYVTAVSSFDHIHVKHLLEPYIKMINNHPFFKLFKGNVNRSPTYQITFPSGHTVEGVNMNIASKSKIGCVDKETEILTDNGWKYFKDLTYNDKVLSMNPKTNIANYYPIKKIIKYKYKGELIALNRYNEKFLFTPDHKILIKSTDKINKLVKVTSKLPKQIYTPCLFKWQGENKRCFHLLKNDNYHLNQKVYTKFKIENWVKFLAWYLSEGSLCKNKGHYVIDIPQKKYFKEIEKLLNDMGISYNKFEDKINNTFHYRITNKQIYSHLLKYCGKVKSKKIPKYIKHLSSNVLKVFIDCYILGDGTINKKTKEKRITTSLSSLANELQEVSLKAGYNVTIRTRNVFGFHWHKMYDICFVKSKYKVFQRRQIENVKYNDYVFCVEVEPYHLIYIRRKGIPIWTGNSQWERVHASKIYIDEHQYETDEVVSKRSQSTSELGAIERFAGITSFKSHSPAGKVFTNLTLANWLINLPRTVSNTWNKITKQKAIDDYDGEETLAYKIHILAELCPDAEGLYDMDRIRKSYNRKKTIKHLEITKKNYYRFKDLLIVERPSGVDKILIASDFGETAPTEIAIFGEIQYKGKSFYKYLYNITLHRLVPDEQTEIMKYLIDTLSAEVFGMDASEQGGRQICRDLRAHYKTKDNIIMVKFNEKIVVGFEEDENGKVKCKNGEAITQKEFVIDWAVRRLKYLLYDGEHAQLPLDSKFDRQFAAMVAVKTGNRIKYGCKEQDHLHAAFQVFAIIQWVNKMAKVKPLKKFNFGTGACSWSQSKEK